MLAAATLAANDSAPLVGVMGSAAALGIGVDEAVAFVPAPFHTEPGLDMLIAAASEAVDVEVDVDGATATDSSPVDAEDGDGDGDGMDGASNAREVSLGVETNGGWPGGGAAVALTADENDERSVAGEDDASRGERVAGVRETGVVLVALLGGALEFDVLVCLLSLVVLRLTPCIILPGMNSAADLDGTNGTARAVSLESDGVDTDGLEVETEAGTAAGVGAGAGARGVEAGVREGEEMAAPARRAANVIEGDEDLSRGVPIGVAGALAPLTISAAVSVRLVAGVVAAPIARFELSGVVRLGFGLIAALMEGFVMDHGEPTGSLELEGSVEAEDALDGAPVAAASVGNSLSACISGTSNAGL